jgi:DNA-directed RNA polymerase subunit alpha
MNIILPSQISSDHVDTNHSVLSISPCYPGYGTTLGNALRRVLLSSLPGAAVTAIKIKGVDHEFSTIPHVKEDVVEIILNMKSLRFLSHSDEPVELELTAKGEGVVTAKAFAKNSAVEVANPEQPIATITDKAGELTIKAIVERGRGYLPVEDRDTEKLDVGYIAIDAVYTPVRNVNYRTEHVRVGQMTNFDKLIMDISTDGTVSPEEAFRTAAGILVEQFQVLSTEQSAASEAAAEVAEPEGEPEQMTMPTGEATTGDEDKTDEAAESSEK